MIDRFACSVDWVLDYTGERSLCSPDNFCQYVVIKSRKWQVKQSAFLDPGLGLLQMLHLAGDTFFTVFVATTWQRLS